MFDLKASQPASDHFLVLELDCFYGVIIIIYFYFTVNIIEQKYFLINFEKYLDFSFKI